MRWHHKPTFAARILAKLYKIEPDLLADDNQHAWTNLGLWQASRHNYVASATQLASHMGQALALSADDHVLDIGCGYGASLHLWHKKFNVKQISALELQPLCCQTIEQQHLTYVEHIFQQSIFDEKPKNYHALYDVIVSVDATYHYALTDYLNAISAWLAPQGRIGFHLLMRLNEDDLESSQAQQALKNKLKWAKIDFDQVLQQQQILATLTAYGYQQIKIEDLSQQVLAGFYQFVANKPWSLKQKMTVGYAKIYATAELCRSLAVSKQCAYIQVTAQKVE